MARMSPESIERMHEIRKLYDAGDMTFLEIAKIFGISASRCTQIYHRAVQADKFDAVKREFEGLYWIPAYGIYEEGIRTKEQLNALSDDVILYILNKHYGGLRGNKPRTDLLDDVRRYLGRGGNDQ